MAEISEKEYQALAKKYGDEARAMPSMSLLAIKCDKEGKPARAKPRAAVLGSLERRMWEKSGKYAPATNPASARLLLPMAAEKGRCLKPGGCKNAFCHPHIPDDELAIAQPPKGCPRPKPGACWKLRKRAISTCRKCTLERHWSLMRVGCYWVAGKENPADLFTKEHRDLAQFRMLRDLMVIPREDFVLGAAAA